MTGPEHYRDAERLATEAVRVSPSFNDLPFGEHVTGTQHAEELLALAQVHAMLALAAATALGARGTDNRPAGMHLEDFIAWDDVAGVEGE